ncbi:MAG: RsmB/NOP family class I SAM-dependent RNA methyltransferase [Holosporales bacterium]|jgi:16S rRNA (cytosine967-C5)-methyltransferase|nr:RsmB/NOP family class I SAM-dependent RNA methyltransferase [Holosporales bacterium]
MVLSGIKSITMEIEITPFLRKSLVALVECVLAHGQCPADTIFQNFVQEKRLNSTKRRLLASLFFDLLRKYWACVSLAAANNAEHIVSAYFKLQEMPGTPEWPATLPMNMSNDIWQSFQNSFESPASAIREAKEVQKAAFVDIRVNTFAGFTKSFVARSLCAAGLFVDELPLEDGLRLKDRVDFSKNQLYKEGAFEIQDFGSQLVARLCCFAGVSSVLDYCAGGGGKSLAILNALPKLQDLCLADIAPTRLTAAKLRFSKIRDFARQKRLFEGEMGPTKTFFQNIHTGGKVSFGAPGDVASDPFDLVIVDAPCSGIGTLKRNPWLTVHLSKSKIEDYAGAQRGILSNAANFVKKGGYIAYITCSLLREENEDIVAAFLAANPDFAPIDVAQCWELCYGCNIPIPLGVARPSLRLLPSFCKSDGFFLSIMRKK